jgi:hypothetical protein
VADARRELFALIAAMVGGVGAALTISSIWKISIYAACECHPHRGICFLVVANPEGPGPHNLRTAPPQRVTEPLSATKSPFAGRIALDEIDTREPAVRVQC